MFDLVDMLISGLTLSDNVIVLLRFFVLLLVFKFALAFMDVLVGGRSVWRR